MEKTDLLTVATFANAEEAKLAREMLAEEGIRAFLEGEATVGMLWYLGNALGGVKLQVAAEEAERAKTLLERKVADEAPSSAAGACDRCGADREPGFATCWSCGGAFGEPAEEDPDVPPALASKVPGNADPGVEEEEEPDEQLRAADAAARRAWQAAVIGIFLLPPLLSFYSVWLLIQLDNSDAPLSARGERWQRWAWGANIFASVLIAIFLGIAWGVF